MVVFNENCMVHVLKMCNGLIHCDNCADEVYEDCLNIPCPDSTIYILTMLL